MKRRMGSIFLLVIFIASPLMAQSYDVIKSAFQDFSSDVANTLPYLSSIGLNWSDAYIGGFPHFGVGLTAGAVTMPYDSVKNVADSLGISLSSLPSVVETLGMPLPAWCLEGRLGGFGIPFDIGVKFGFLPEEAKALLPSNLSFDYTLIGADVRFALVEENGAAPDISIGAGVNYMSGRVTVFGVTPALTYDLAPYYPGHNLSLTAGDLDFFWRALTIDVKAQVSKKLAIFTLYVGAAASYSIYAEAGGGIASQVLYDGGPISQAEIDALKSVLPGLEDLSATNLSVKGSANGWGFRAFGGLSLDIAIVKIDLTAMYNILSNSLGASVNLRLQF